MFPYRCFKKGKIQMNEIQIFNNSDFGKARVTTINNVEEN